MSASRRWSGNRHRRLPREAVGRGATVVSPFIIGALMGSSGLPGVIWLMIALVVIQILVVWAWGVEPRNRGLEDVAAKT